MSRVRLLRVPGCPLADRVRATLREAIREASVPVVVEESVGDHPSPTVLVDGVDAVTGEVTAGGACCRLDLPTRAQIVRALRG
ncbi:hypothetical protein GCM10009854_49800 [Saccharopolyspora halophila]|uniref:Alkylmercury lyase n=1 Tax=Saccharopolyspora halophila TaxID=405551 RepID=A0ABN3GZ31_9PSEU